MTWLECGVKFGTALRCLRLGYHPIRDLGLVRIAAKGPPYRIDVCPFDQLPAIKGGAEEFVVWWLGPAERIEATIRELFPQAPTAAVAVFVDDDGKPKKGK